MAGRKPKPFIIKKLGGNPGKRPLVQPTIQAGGALACPSWLDSVAKSEWRRVLKCAPLELLGSLDRGILTAYCMAWSRLKKTTVTLRKEGETFTTDKGYMGPHPAIVQANQAMEQLRKLGAEMGFTPASRERIHPRKKDDEQPHGVLNGEWDQGQPAERVN